MVVMLFSERRADAAFQMGRVVGYDVRQIAMLRVAPSRLDRVELRRIGGSHSISMFLSATRPAVWQTSDARASGPNRMIIGRLR